MISKLSIKLFSRIHLITRLDHIFFHFVCLFLMGLSLTGCSKTQLAYHFSDWFLIKKVDDYFQLNHSQEKFLEEKFSQLITWHRTHELPDIVLTLSEFQKRYQDGLDPEDVKWLQDDERSYFKRFFVQAAPDFAQFLTSLEDGQIQYFKNQSNKMNDFLIKQINMTDEEMVEDTQQWFLELLENWFGPLDSEQKQMLKIWVSVERDWIESKLENRRNFQKKFAELLETRKSKREIEAQLIHWIKHPEAAWSPEFKGQWEIKKSEWINILLIMDSTITPGQRNRALEKVQGYIDDFKSLAI